MLTIICLVLIATIMYARLNDLRLKKRKGWGWRVRMVGFVLCGTGSVSLIAHDWLLMTRDFTWSEVMFIGGAALTFATTPHLPPLWGWLSGSMPHEDGSP